MGRGNEIGNEEGDVLNDYNMIDVGMLQCKRLLCVPLSLCSLRMSSISGPISVSSTCLAACRDVCLFGMKWVGYRDLEHAIYAS
jgi:hypothetical protein